MIPCPLCRKAKGKVCPYHAATTPEDLLQAASSDIAKRGVNGLVRLVLAGQSRLVDLPDPVLDDLAERGFEQVSKQFAEVLEKPEFSQADLQLLAALSLVLAALHDPEPEEGDTRK